jgi:predicted phage terminase large subunit-like protein
MLQTTTELSTFEEDKLKLLGSLLLFTQVFYKLRTGREFVLSNPPGRESHYITICRALMRVLRGQTSRLIINIPPRYGKTELIIQFIAWCLAHYPDSNFLYISYALKLAKKQTQTVKEILEMPHYRKMFGVELAGDTTAKDNFETTAHGSVYASGAEGTITGRGAGIKECNRFGGAVLIDDIHKPAEGTSDVIREGIIDWYYNTLQSRINSPSITPIIYIGQRVHEDDLAARLLATGDWETVILPALDNAGNPLHPEMHTREMLLEMEARSPYEVAAQYQQDPQPAGGGIFKPDWFSVLEEEPEIIATFITGDTAETDKTWNDATVFSFWGLYKIKEFNMDLDLYGLHWINCVELRCEPKDLEAEFNAFYVDCMRYRVKPMVAAIEKKSTGVTLTSILKARRGIQIIDIERTKASGNKAARFLEIQPYVSSKRISFTKGDKHIDMCIDHCRKITANDSHRHDDIADTLYDAIKVALIDKIVARGTISDNQTSSILREMINNNNNLQRLRREAYG